MDEFDRGVRAAVVAQDIFYGVGQAIGLGIVRHHANQVAMIAELEAEAQDLCDHVTAAEARAHLWELYARELEVERSQLIADYNQLATDYDGLVRNIRNLEGYTAELQERLRGGSRHNRLDE